MDLEDIIKRLKEEFNDVKEHNADYCYASTEDTEAIIEYLSQLNEIKNNK